MVFTFHAPKEPIYFFPHPCQWKKLNKIKNIMDLHQRRNGIKNEKVMPTEFPSLFHIIIYLFCMKRRGSLFKLNSFMHAFKAEKYKHKMK